MYELRLNDVTITDSNIISIDGNISLSIIMDELKADELRFKVSYPNLTAFPNSIEKGRSVLFYKDSELVGKYFVSEFTQTGNSLYDLTVTSIIGVWDKKYYKGNYFDQKTLSYIVADITDELEVSELVSDITLSGFLKYDTVRETLHQVMFATGTNIIKKSNGDPLLTGLSRDVPSNTINDDEIYSDGLSYKISQEASKVIVTEHTYALEDDAEYSTAFDNTDGQYQYNVLVKFASPIDTASIQTDGVQVTDLTPASCVVTGQGTLKVKQYTHTEYEINREDEDAYQVQEVSSNGCTMVSALNGNNVLNRLFSYYTKIKKAKFSVSNLGHKCGDGVSAFFWGEEHDGRITALDFVYSKIVKANVELTCDYELIPPGNNYTKYRLLTGSGRFTVPANVKKIRVYMLGGGNGGYSGTRSGSAQEGETVAMFPNWHWNSHDIIENHFRLNDHPNGVGYYGINNSQHIRKGGSGGKAGDAGEGGKLFSMEFDTDGGEVIEYYCGAGGAGGQGTKEDDESHEGSEGGSTTIVYKGHQYTSNIGRRNPLINVFTGIIYGGDGYEGLPGGDGGSSGNVSKGNMFGASGQNYDDTYRGGQGGQEEIYESYEFFTSCGGGSGAAYGANGKNGGVGYCIKYAGDQWFTDDWERRIKGGDGGDGVTPSTPPIPPQFGRGGTGGFGAGGPGAGGCTYTTGEAWEVTDAFVQRTVVPILQGKYGEGDRRLALLTNSGFPAITAQKLVNCVMMYMGGSIAPVTPNWLALCASDAQQSGNKWVQEMPGGSYVLTYDFQDKLYYTEPGHAGAVAAGGNGGTGGDGCVLIYYGEPEEDEE